MRRSEQFLLLILIGSLAVIAGGQGWTLPSIGPVAVESPFPADVFAVLILEDVEGGGSLAPYYSATASATVRKWNRENGVTMHVRDDDTELDGYWADAKEQLLLAGLLPGMIARNGSRSYQGTVPATTEAMIKELERLEGGR